MICSKCGASIPDEAAFCPQCGAKDPAQPVQTAQTVQGQPAQGQFAQAQPAQNTQPAQYTQPAQNAPKANPLGGVTAKIKNNKALKVGILGGAALIVIIIIIAVIAANAGGGSAFTMVENGYMSFTMDGESRYFYNGELISKTTEPFMNNRLSPNGKAQAIVADGTLYYFKGTDVKTVAEDVNTITISDDGSTLAYLAENVISVYNGSSKTVAELDSDERFSSMVLSPDGGALVYFVEKNGKYKAYGWKGGEPVSLGSYSYGFVSNGGSVFYGINEKNKAYYVKNFDESTKESLGAYFSLYGITADKRGIIFSGDGKCRVFDPSFKEVKTFSADYVDIAYPSGAFHYLPDVKSFVMYSDGKLYRVTLKGGEYDKTVLARNVDAYQLSADGKTIIFKRNDTLYRASALKVTENPEKLAENVRTFSANSSLSDIYCTTYDDELLYIKGKGKTEKVESDRPDSFTALENGVCFYTIDDEYKYSTGGKGKRCDGVGEADDSYGSYSTSANTVYAFSDGYIYTSQDGKKFTKTKVEYDY